MTDFKTIHGKKIKFLTSDLTMSTTTEGELIYSDTDNSLLVDTSKHPFHSLLVKDILYKFYNFFIEFNFFASLHLPSKAII